MQLHITCKHDKREQSEKERKSNQRPTHKNMNRKESKTTDKQIREDSKNSLTHWRETEHPPAIQWQWRTNYIARGIPKKRSSNSTRMTR